MLKADRYAFREFGPNWQVVNKMQPVKRIMYDTGSSRTLCEFPDGHRDWILPLGLYKELKDA